MTAEVLEMRKPARVVSNGLTLFPLLQLKKLSQLNSSAAQSLIVSADLGQIPIVEQFE
jgi:hypothetical protein